MSDTAIISALKFDSQSRNKNEETQSSFGRLIRDSYAPLYPGIPPAPLCEYFNGQNRLPNLAQILTPSSPAEREL